MLGLIIASSSIRAADSSSAPASAAPLDDSIAAAKRQLDLLKSDANASKAGTQIGATPSIAMPQLHTTDEDAGATAMQPTLPNNKSANKRRQNWLVDAMMKPKSGRNGERSGDRSKPDKLDARGRPMSDEPRAFDARDEDRPSAPESLVQADEEATADAEAAKSPRPKEPTNTINPFSRYMSSWLAPQDYSVLRRTVDSPTDSTPAGNALPAQASVSGADSPLAGALTHLGLDASGNDAPRPLPKPADNPFLQMLAAPPSPPPATTLPDPMPPLQPSPPAATAPVTPPPEVAPQKPLIPDFAKPSDDDKYFKPLKRF